LFDVGFAVAALFVLSPLLVGIAIVICLDSPGYPFYSDERCGRDGRRFRMVKFRTMHTGAADLQAALVGLNDADEPLFKLKSDPRVTRCGRLLRRWSIDELPQLANVLLGHMSLIGPRPFVVSEATALNSLAQARTQMRPGMSGPWQVSGRAELPTDELIRLDTDYVENWMFRRDVRLMAATLRAVVTGHGAY
jgi:lipopolysaccharide/colanic/teichoic acid biosynthesis glycosyltransferase